LPLAFERNHAAKTFQEYADPLVSMDRLEPLVVPLRNDNVDLDLARFFQNEAIDEVLPGTRVRVLKNRFICIFWLCGKTPFHVLIDCL
jgi:hypothetical protein